MSPPHAGTGMPRITRTSAVVLAGHLDLVLYPVAAIAAMLAAQCRVVRARRSRRFARGYRIGLGVIVAPTVAMARQAGEAERGAAAQVGTLVSRSRLRPTTRFASTSSLGRSGGWR